MEWEDKTKMIKLGNQIYKGDQEKKEFQDYVLEHLEDFDNQAWDMFVTIVQIVIDEMKVDIDFWMKIWSKLKDIDCNDEKFGFRSGMRLALIQTICEDELLLK